MKKLRVPLTIKGSNKDKEKTKFKIEEEPIEVPRHNSENGQAANITLIGFALLSLHIQNIHKHYHQYFPEDKSKKNDNDNNGLRAELKQLKTKMENLESEINKGTNTAPSSETSSSPLPLNLPSFLDLNPLIDKLKEILEKLSSTQPQQPSISTAHNRGPSNSVPLNSRSAQTGNLPNPLPDLAKVVDGINGLKDLLNRLLNKKPIKPEIIIKVIKQALPSITNSYDSHDTYNIDKSRNSTNTQSTDPAIGDLLKALTEVIKAAAKPAPVPRINTPITIHPATVTVNQPPIPDYSNLLQKLLEALNKLPTVGRDGRNASSKTTEQHHHHHHYHARSNKDRQSNPTKIRRASLPVTSTSSIILKPLSLTPMNTNTAPLNSSTSSISSPNLSLSSTTPIPNPSAVTTTSPRADTTEYDDLFGRMKDVGAKENGKIKESFSDKMKSHTAKLSALQDDTAMTKATNEHNTKNKANKNKSKEEDTDSKGVKRKAAVWEKASYDSTSPGNFSITKGNSKIDFIIDTATNSQGSSEGKKLNINFNSTSPSSNEICQAAEGAQYYCRSEGSLDDGNKKLKATINDMAPQQAIATFIALKLSKVQNVNFNNLEAVNKFCDANGIDKAALQPGASSMLIGALEDQFKAAIKNGVKNTVTTPAAVSNTTSSPPSLTLGN